MGVLGVLQVVFIVLKLVHVIEWAWSAVLIPLWILIAFCIISLIIDKITKEM